MSSSSSDMVLKKNNIPAWLSKDLKDLKRAIAMQFLAWLPKFIMFSSLFFFLLERKLSGMADVLGSIDRHI